MPASLASAALIKENFDLLKTIEVAKEKGFSSVQLFIDGQKYDSEYIRQLIESIRNSNITSIVTHLHNLGYLTSEELVIAETIENALPDRKIVTLVHYEEGMLPDNVPMVNKKKVAIENAKTGVFDADYLMEVYRFIRFLNIPMVFDHCRIMYPDNKNSPESIIEFIKWFITTKLIPGYDVIHTADKTLWNMRFKECWTYLGDPNGICYPLLPTLRSFSDHDGIVVFEHEDLEMATRSLKTFK